MSDLKVAPVVPDGEFGGGGGGRGGGGGDGAELRERQLLVVVLDINPNQPFFARNPKYLLHWLDSVLALVNSHLMLNAGNGAAAVAAHAQGCSFLYPSERDDGDGDGLVAGSPDGQFEGFYKVESTVRRSVEDIVRRETEPGAPVVSESLLSGALCMALSYVNRMRQEAAEGAAGNAHLSSRILVMSASGDTTTQYMTYMNAFFSAQKMQVRLDTCMVEQDSGLLQQGADITGGVYQRVTMRHFPSLLQFLIWIFLPDAGLRCRLSLPSAERVDYRAACFCHRELVDIGYVCSVCLSIFCKFSPMCTTCHTFFKTPMLKAPLPSASKKKRTAAAAGSTAGKSGKK